MLEAWERTCSCSLCHKAAEARAQPRPYKRCPRSYAGGYGGGGLQIAPLDLGLRAAAGGGASLGGRSGSAGGPSSLDSEATYGNAALLGSSAPSPATVLPPHPAQARAHALSP